MHYYRITLDNDQCIKIRAKDYTDMAKKLLDYKGISNRFVKSIKAYTPTLKGWVECGRLGI